MRIRTELVQTSVMVFDKQGQFVDGLKREDFELRADGKIVPLSFFEKVLSGGVREGGGAALGEQKGTASAFSAPTPLEAARGRTVMFFLDDLHLSLTSHKRVRDAILNFINNEMRPYDVVAITSSSGKIGFLQQFTDDKTVLRAAVARVSPTQNRAVRDGGYPPMSVDEAIAIDRNDRDMLDFFVDLVIKEGFAISTSRSSIEETVRERARSIVQYSGDVALSTFSSLEQLVRSAAQAPGLKVAFFISDGFIMDFGNSTPTLRMQRIADAAARSGVVVYSLDARGIYNAQKDASDESLFDPTALSLNSRSTSFKEMQDPLNAIAASTGGRFIRNTNDFKTAIKRALEETGSYYMLAWRPDPETQSGGKFRKLEVSIRNHPDLKVRVQGGYLSEPQKAAAKLSKKQVKEAAQAATPEGQMRAAITAPFPKRELPISLSLAFLYPADKSPNLTANLQVSSRAVEFTPENGVARGKVDVVCLIFDDKGKQVGFIKDSLSKTAPSQSSASGSTSDFFYSYRAALKPGLYQVRIAARDTKSGRVGSASQWIEIPNMTSGKLAMSSLIVGERAAELKAIRLTDAATSGTESASLNVERRFGRTSVLRYVTYVYNASRGPAGTLPPNIVLQTYVFLDKTSVMSTQPMKVSTVGQDPVRLAYAAEVPLESLAPGRYVLQVIAIDRNSNSSTRQMMTFDIK